MAARLLAAGHEVTLYNRTAEHAQPLLSKGASFAATPLSAVSGAELVVSMLRDDAASADVWCDGERGALAGLSSNAIAVECSTVTQQWALRLHALVAQRGAQCLDAPVLGSRPQAEAGALIFLVGGDASVLERARSVLSSLGGAILHAGPAGHGATLKLIVNALFGIQVTAMSELLQLARSAGLQEQALPGLLEQIPVVSPAARNATNLMLAGKHDAMFPIELVIKDLEYVRRLDRSTGPHTTLIDATLGRFQQAQARGLGGRNITAVDLLNRAG
jgi:3-hydroxyisobutyrate dehydrogenase-like beta-hydroxyacid dehydrogenase